MQEIKAYMEIGESRTFAVSLDWPGWARSGRNEASALQALCDYGPRYAQTLQATKLAFHPPSDVEAFTVIERLKGTTTTDFGAPDVALSSDTDPVDEDDLKKWQEILQACWQTFDKAVESATGHTLKKGPRGGGRDLAKIIEHVQGVDVAYLKSLGGTLAHKEDKGAPLEVIERIRPLILSTLEAAVRGEIPAQGPRGGTRWSPRYFVRRLAWHDLDHAWEIEDKIT